MEPQSSKIGSVARSLSEQLKKGSEVVRSSSNTTQVGNAPFGLLLGHGLLVPGALYIAPRYGRDSPSNTGGNDGRARCLVPA